MVDLRQLGFEIRVARERASMTQGELGQHLGISRASVSLLESGGTKWPRMEMLSTIAELLHVPPTMLFELAGLKLDAPSSAQLQWLATQLTTERVDLLVEIGHTMLREQGRQLARAPQAAARSSRSRP